MVAEDVGMATNNGFADFSVSGNGALFYGRGRNAGKGRFGWRDRAGKLLETIGQPFENTGRLFSLSPDGARVAFTTGARHPDVWVLELARGVSTRITFNSATSPQWSPDGKQLYNRNPGGIHRKAADGSGEEELMVKGTSAGPTQCVSPDGKYLLFRSTDIMKLPLSGERKPEPYLQTKYWEGNASFSADGRWIAYSSNESGRLEIYVQGFPEPRGKWLVSTAGGVSAHWRADGKELYWRTQDNTLMAATVELQKAGVRVGRPERLFLLPESSYFQPARDGRRFLVLEPEGTPPPDLPMVVIQNWAAGLTK